MSIPFPMPQARKGPASTEQIPFTGMTAEQVRRRARGMEPDPPRIYRVYLRGRDQALVVEGAQGWAVIDGLGVVNFYRDVLNHEGVIACFRWRDVVAIFEPEPMKPRAI